MYKLTCTEIYSEVARGAETASGVPKQVFLGSSANSVDSVVIGIVHLADVFDCRVEFLGGVV